MTRSQQATQATDRKPTSPHRAEFGAAFCALFCLLLSSACATAPQGRLLVDRVDIRGARSLTTSELQERLSTHATSTFAGITLAYEVYDKFVVERDLQRIERIYRAHGFYDARAIAGRVIKTEQNHVRIEVEITEGQPTTVSNVRVQYPKLEKAAGEAVSAVNNIRIGDRLNEEALEELRSKLVRALNDNGYAHAKVIGGFRDSDLVPVLGEPRVLDPTEQIANAEAFKKAILLQQTGNAEDPRRYAVRVDPVQKKAEVFFIIEPGEPCTYGEVQFQFVPGSEVLPEEVIRREARLRKGKPYSTAEIENARFTLLSLGVFSSVEVDPPPETGTELPVVFRLKAAPLRTITLGGGVQADVLRTDTHFVAGYQHNNFLGGLRRVIAQVKPGLVLFPTNLSNGLLPTRVVPELKAKAELRQPSFIEARTAATLRSEFLIYPFLLPIVSAADVPDVILGYYEIREAAGLDRAFFHHRFTSALFYHLQISYPFTYLGPLDEGVTRAIISHVSWSQALDLRDNPLRPHKGIYLANEVQFAGGFAQGDADDIRIQPDARFYAPLSKKATFASRASIGFLFPRSYGETLSQIRPDPALDPEGAAEFDARRNRDLQLLFFRAFFSGGPNSNRGYPIRGVGPRGVAPFNLGGGGSNLAACQGRVPGGAGVSGAAAQLAKLPAVDPEVCGVPLGGLSLWEASLELRYDFTTSFSSSIFLDASDVTREKLRLRFDFPHLSTGVGLRYETPVGPLRVDLGYAIPSLQCLNNASGKCDPVQEGSPSNVLGVPIALNIAVGEAF